MQTLGGDCNVDIRAAPRGPVPIAGASETSRAPFRSSGSFAFRPKQKARMKPICPMTRTFFERTAVLRRREERRCGPPGPHYGGRGMVAEMAAPSSSAAPDVCPAPLGGW